MRVPLPFLLRPVPPPSPPLSPAPRRRRGERPLRRQARGPPEDEAAGSGAQGEAAAAQLRAPPAGRRPQGTAPPRPQRFRELPALQRRRQVPGVLRRRSHRAALEHPRLHGARAPLPAGQRGTGPRRARPLQPRLQVGPGSPPAPRGSPVGDRRRRRCETCHVNGVLASPPGARAVRGELRGPRAGKAAWKAFLGTGEAALQREEGISLPGVLFHSVPWLS